MRKQDLPSSIRRRVEAAERQLQCPILLRGARWPDPTLRGHILRSQGVVVIEYRDDVAGYFWHYDIISELLDHVEEGHLVVSLRDGGGKSKSIEEVPHLGPDC